MKRALLASAALIGFSVAALAADLPRAAPPAYAPPVYAPPAFTWSGFYIGGHVGYGWSDFDFRDPTVTINGPILLPTGSIIGVPLERQFHADNGIGGGQVGFNAQFGPMVVGVEGDFTWTDLSGRYRSTSGPTAIGPFALTTAEGAAAKVDWVSTVRSRLGFAFDRFLVYGTGGVAFGEVRGSGDITATLPPLGSLSLAANDRRTHVGWTAGGGIEAAITSNLSVKVEYLYTDLGREHHEAPALVTGTPTVAGLIPAGTAVRAAGEFSAQVQTVKAGLNYRFNLFGP